MQIFIIIVCFFNGMCVWDAIRKRAFDGIVLFSFGYVVMVPGLATIGGLGLTRSLLITILPGVIGSFTIPLLKRYLYFKGA